LHFARRIKAVEHRYPWSPIDVKRLDDIQFRVFMPFLKEKTMATSAEEKKIAKPSSDFPFEIRYVSVAGHRISYIESGGGDPVLFIHGNPTSSYLWRNILPGVARDTGSRGIALDLLGFGESDKPGSVAYSLRLHAAIIEGFIEQLDLRKLILVLHDWGGPLGAAYAINHPENVRGIIFMETFLWPLVWKDFGNYAIMFKLFRSPLGHVLIQVMNVFVNNVLPGAVLRKDNMTEEVMHHYRSPFPTIGSRRAIRAFPILLPIEGNPSESDVFLEDIQQRIQNIKIPALWIKAVPGAVLSSNTEYHLHLLQGQLPQLTIKDFGLGLHYLQEENPEKIVELITQWMHENILASKCRDSLQPKTFKHAA
jgi:haloalkane dehalogenase